MHADAFLHKLLGSVICSSRLFTLSCVLDALMKTKEMTLTHLGRSLNLPIQERSAIRKMDRFLENKGLQKRTPEIYRLLIARILGTSQKPCLIVDWSKLPNTEHYVLRVGTMSHSRSLTLYEEVYPKEEEHHPKAHENFLKNFKALLPAGCQPILVTDAGFKNPWFKAVLALGFDYIGRVRGCTHYKDAHGYQSIQTLFSKAKVKPSYEGEMVLSKKRPLQTHFYLAKRGLQGRKRYTKSKKVSEHKDSKAYSKSHREPWLLVTSLSPEHYSAEKMVAIYGERMKIEESFRDLKSDRYGLGFDKNKTLKKERYLIWLLIAALGSAWAWIVGYMAEKQNLHYAFQANSIKHRRVLSFFYLGCQLIRKKWVCSINLKKLNFIMDFEP